MDHLKTFLIALQFFTRVPVTGALGRWADYSPERLNRAAAFFPWVGLVVGGVSAAFTCAAWQALATAGDVGLMLAALSGLAASLWLTGAFHEDGLADTFDALGGHVSRERALEIMKDSRLGSYGTVALVVVLGAKVLLIAAVLKLNPSLALVTVVAAHVASRAAPLWVMRCLPYISPADTSKSKPLAERLGTGGFAFALFSAASLASGCWWLAGLWRPAPPAWAMLAAAGLAGLAATAWLVSWFRRRLDGFTGDCLGTTQQLSELAIWGAVLWMSTLPLDRA